MCDPILTKTYEKEHYSKLKKHAPNRKDCDQLACSAQITRDATVYSTSNNVVFIFQNFDDSLDDFVECSETESIAYRSFTDLQSPNSDLDCDFGS